MRFMLPSLFTKKDLGETKMTLYFREATPQEKKEDGLDYRLTDAGANAYEKWKLKQRQRGENESLTIFLVHTVYKLQTKK